MTDKLMPPPGRDDFERWYANSDARWWNTSDAMFAAWQAAIAAERERCAKLVQQGGAPRSDEIGDWAFPEEAIRTGMRP